ncbi:hypothetical protein AMATHDRAFT_45895 [Amanita thiersii Skay4041]|uniref:Methanethiol oxidase n=1 Tax=Amanita thiersii Skay4041 TaxID=703135 RepID=A0A2A9NYS0_9AGAR|nr:hypothetical protein AMATHDRAFT_45895 [Amanita thiersii Skay4041]
MKLSIALLSFVASAVFATQRNHVQLLPRHGTKEVGEPLGAAYFLTNEWKDNMIIVANIGSDGTLSLHSAVRTNGNGGHGNPANPNNTDPMFSQASIKASPAGVLAAVNAGSSTISAYWIQDENPSVLLPMGNPVGSNGDFPVSIAFNNAGDVVCVLNGGAVNTVSCFKVDHVKGLLPITNATRPLGLNQTTPPTGLDGTASNIIFSEDNCKLIASVKGKSDKPGFLAVWDVSQDWSLSENFTRVVAPPPCGMHPSGLALIPGKDAVLAADADVGFSIYANVEGKAAPPAAGGVHGDGQSSTVTIPGQVGVGWAVRSPKTNSYFLSDIGTSRLTVVNVDDHLKGTIVKQYEAEPGSNPTEIDIATLGGKDFLYVLLPNATSIDVVALESASVATRIQRLNLIEPAHQVNITIDPRNLHGMTTYVKKGQPQQPGSNQGSVQNPEQAGTVPEPEQNHEQEAKPGSEQEPKSESVPAPEQESAQESKPVSEQAPEKEGFDLNSE